MSGTLKFVFIAVCFGTALGSYFFCKNKRDWFWLTLALGFTLAADYFLVLHDWHLLGVAVFCFAHLAYIGRALAGNRQIVTSAELRQKDRYRGPVLGAGSYKLVIALLAVIAAAITIAFFVPIGIFIVTVLYAVLFVTNIYVNARYLQHNRKLAITGLLLFAACDICVLLFNLPVYMGAPVWLRGVFPLIWVFYLPSQILLSVSAMDYSRTNSKNV